MELLLLLVLVLVCRTWRGLEHGAGDTPWSN